MMPYIIETIACKRMFTSDQKSRFIQPPGQSLVEFALILPLFALLIVGIFDLGRAFFAYIAISNAAREGTRVFTFTPDKTTVANIYTAVDAELGTNSVVDPANITLIEIQCVDPVTNIMTVVNTDTELRACKSESPIRVTINYSHELILSFFFRDPLTLARSAEMMVP